MAEKTSRDGIWEENIFLAIMEAARRGRADIMRLLLTSLDANQVTRITMNAAIRLASSEGAESLDHYTKTSAPRYAETVRVLLELNDHRISRQGFRQALKCAAHIGRGDIVRVLVEFGDPYFIDDSLFQMGAETAARQGNLDIQKLLQVCESLLNGTVVHVDSMSVVADLMLAAKYAARFDRAVSLETIVDRLDDLLVELQEGDIVPRSPEVMAVWMRRLAWPILRRCWIRSVVQSPGLNPKPK